MKNALNPFLFILVLLLTFSFSCQRTSDKRNASEAIYAEIDSLIQVKNYFDARLTFNQNKDLLIEYHILKAGAHLDYAFNKPDSAIFKTNRLLKKYNKQMGDSIKHTIESMSHINYSRLYEYGKARQSLENFISNYSDYFTEKEKNDLENTLIIWKALDGQPKQVVRKEQGLDMEIIRDKAGLNNLVVSNGSFTRDFIFDTGANISTITQSTAEGLGVIILDGTFDVTSITGGKVVSQVGIIPVFTLGDIVVENMVALVFPDEALAFPQVGYQIHGILGFPVIEAFDELQITSDGRFIVPQTPTEVTEPNLALEFLTPLIWLKDSRGKGIYTFDTGATTTMLYDTYFDLYREDLAELHEEAEYTFGGAGGVVSKKGIYISFFPEINGTTLELDSIIVLQEPLRENNFFLGNIGQDLINNFQTLTINFDDMFILME